MSLVNEKLLGIVVVHICVHMYEEVVVVVVVGSM